MNTKRYDIIVCGGGIAGIAAALAARRQGQRVLLIEKQYLLGGLATAGLVTIFLPLCDGMGNQVSYGIAEELLRLSVKYGEESINADIWLNGTGSLEERSTRRFQTQFNASLFAILCEQLLIDEGVELLYGTTIISVKKTGNRISSIITASKSGIIEYTAKAFIDATGDADLFWYAGTKTQVFKQGNLEAQWYYEIMNGEYYLRTLGSSDIPDKYKSREQIENDYRIRYIGLDTRELTEFVIAGHHNILQDFLSKGDLTSKHILASIATIPQMRMTRRIVGNYTMNDEEYNKRFEDSVGLFSDWRKSGVVYELPFSCLFGGLDNVFACGRCISVTDDMWDITRVIPVCALSGQAVGTAASIMNKKIDDISITELQSRLRGNAVKLHI